MTISISPRFGFTLWDSPDDQVQREQFTANFSAIESLGAQCTIDVRANRPVSGEGQRFFYAEDEQILYYDTGSAWQKVLFTPDSGMLGANRPAPGSAGNYVFETDTLRLYRDAGSRYVEILTSAVIPAGIVMPTLAAVQPPGWLFCDGSAYSPGAYPDLFAVIGTRFGASGGNFRVPDMRGVFLAGAPTLGAGGFGQAGAHAHGSHRHPAATQGHAHQYSFPTSSIPNPAYTAGPVTASGGALPAWNTSDAGVPTSAQLLTYLYASYLIKATGGVHD